MVRKHGYALHGFPAILLQLLMGQGAEGKRSPDAHAMQAVQTQDTKRTLQRVADAASEYSLFERYPDLAARVRGEMLESDTRAVEKPP